MQALILAAGYATRLYPLTQNFPKPLLEIGGISILDRLIADLDGIEAITRHIVVSNHTFMPHFEQWKARSNYAKEVVLVDDGTTSNDNRLGAVRDIVYVLEQLGIDDDLLVLAGDNVVDFSFGGFVEFAQGQQSSCITCHYEPSVAALQKTGVLEADASATALPVPGTGIASCGSSQKYAIQSRTSAGLAREAAKPTIELGGASLLLLSAFGLATDQTSAESRLRVRCSGQPGVVAVAANKGVCLAPSRHPFRYWRSGIV